MEWILRTVPESEAAKMYIVMLGTILRTSS
jgi:hypothetical protein